MGPTWPRSRNLPASSPTSHTTMCPSTPPEASRYAFPILSRARGVWDTSSNQDRSGKPQEVPQTRTKRVATSVGMDSKCRRHTCPTGPESIRPEWTSFEPEPVSNRREIRSMGKYRMEMAFGSRKRTTNRMTPRTSCPWRHVGLGTTARAWGPSRAVHSRIHGSSDE
eukprot:scaffold1322_cov372-Pavlova_lutheri.AAC.11